jgi:hypothetical protein
MSAKTTFMTSKKEKGSTTTNGTLKRKIQMADSK